MRLLPVWYWILAAAPLAAGGWPQWGGPTRDFQLPDAGLAASWPDQGPKRLWKRDIGCGHSSILDDGGRHLYSMYCSGDDEVVTRLDADTGQTLWEFRYPAQFLPGMNTILGSGPHAAALLVGGQLYATGVTGKLHCLYSRRGKLRRYHDSPRILAALDQKTGAVVWTRQGFKNSHASPILIRASWLDTVSRPLLFPGPRGESRSAHDRAR